MSVIVSVVAENTFRVIDIQDITPDMIERQMTAVFEDIGVNAVKVGMLSQPCCMQAVARGLKEYKPRNVVIDPVMVAKNGSELMAATAADTFICEILPLADVLTPNIPEAETLSGTPIASTADMERVAKSLCALGARAVLVKGGHATGDALDVLYDGTEFHHFSAKRINTKNTHGTGCTYSSAIASNLALGYPVTQAVERAKAYVTTAIRHSLALGHGCGPTHHFYDLYRTGLTKGTHADDL